MAIFHASFDAAISRLSYDVVPASNTARFLIFTGVIVAAATAVIIATKGQLGRRAAEAQVDALHSICPGGPLEAAPSGLQGVVQVVPHTLC